MILGLGIRSFWARDPIFLGWDPIFLDWGPDPDLWPQMVKIWMATKWSNKGPHIFLTRAKCIEFQGEQLWFSLNKLTFFGFFSFLTNISKNDQKMSKISSQKCHGKWFGGSTWRSTGMNESVWSPGTPRGLPGAFWGPRGPKKGFLGFFGAGGAGGASRLASLSWADRPISPCAGWRVSALYARLLY